MRSPNLMECKINVMICIHISLRLCKGDTECNKVSKCSTRNLKPLPRQDDDAIYMMLLALALVPHP